MNRWCRKSLKDLFKLHELFNNCWLHQATTFIDNLLTQQWKQTLRHFGFYLRRAFNFSFIICRIENIVKCIDCSINCESRSNRPNQFKAIYILIDLYTSCRYRLLFHLLTWLPILYTHFVCIIYCVIQHKNTYVSRDEQFIGVHPLPLRLYEGSSFETTNRVVKPSAISS